MTAKMRFELIFQWKQQNPSWPLKVLCRVLGVSRSGYALFSKRHKSQAKVQLHHTSDAILLLHIRAAYRRGRCYSGSPRVYDDLREHGIRTSRKRVARLMKQNGLVGRSHTQIAAFEPGQRQINLVQTMEWCAALGASFSDFMVRLDREITAQLPSAPAVGAPAANAPEEGGAA